MLRIFVGLALVIPLLLVITLALEAYGRILPPTPDALLDICALPCVLGVTPNVTDEAEVEGILAFTLPTDSTVTIYDRLGTHTYTFETILGGHYISGLVAMDATGAIVQSISLNSQFPLATLFEKWGAPDCLNLTSYDNFTTAGIFHWQHDSYAAQALFVFQPPNYDWTTADVTSLTITVGLTSCGVGMQTWQGFAPLWRYQ
jgi:hypothetical protein